MKRFIDIHIPVTRCNLNCHYCYVPQENSRNAKETPFMYSAEHIGKALDKKRMGGICHFNMCGLGETLIPKEVVDITYEILKQGHYVMIVTNGLLTNRIKQFVDFPDEYRKRLGFKFSFHYLELKERNLFEVFFGNIEMVRDSGMSFSLELTPSDELEPYIEEVKKLCIEKVGAYCHVTIPRDMTQKGIVLLSKHSFAEFYDVWKTFESDMFEFKSSIWEQKRKEFCYAGEWSGLLNVGNGILSQCYGGGTSQNIFENLRKKVRFIPIGHNCTMPHCYNSHSLLGLGCIPEIKGDYSCERDRVDCRDGSHWLNEEMRLFLSDRLEGENRKHSFWFKLYYDLRWCIHHYGGRLKRKVMK